MTGLALAAVLAFGISALLSNVAGRVRRPVGKQLEDSALGVLLGGLILLGASFAYGLMS